MSSIILLSGPIASGKTTLADELIEAHGFRRLKSSDHLKAVCARNRLVISRTNLQKVGDDLDIETDYRWLVSDVAAPQIDSSPQQTRWLIDAVRKERQIEHFRKAFGTDVLHVHVWAPDELLQQRFNKRLQSGHHHEGGTSYEVAVSHPNEDSARRLKDLADLSINIAEIDLGEAVALILRTIAPRE